MKYTYKDDDLTSVPFSKYPEFKVGDTVYHWSFGKGTIVEIGKYIAVDFITETKVFKLDGGLHFYEPPSLSFTPYDLVNGGFSQKRPRPDIQPGQLIYVRRRESNTWQMRYFSHWEERFDGRQPEAVCFIDQTKEGPTTNWYCYSTTNPLEL